MDATKPGLGLMPFGGLGLSGLLRNDGVTLKGNGYFGPIPVPAAQGGGHATEYSMDFGNGDIPSIVPTLSREEIEMVLRNELTPDIINKINSHAAYRKGQGKSPFAQPGELRMAPGGAGVPGAVGGGLSYELMKLLGQGQ